MNARKLQALRNLAERPGTEAEGKVARAMLAKAEGKRVEQKPRCSPFLFTADPFMQNEISRMRADVAEILRRARGEGNPQDV